MISRKQAEQPQRLVTIMTDKAFKRFPKPSVTQVADGESDRESDIADLEALLGDGSENE